MANPEDLINLPENTTPSDANQMSIQNSSGKWYRMAFSTMVSFFTDFFVSLTGAQSITGIKNFLAKITVLDPVGNNEPETKGRMDALKGSGYEDNPKTIEQIIESVIVPPTYTAPSITNASLSPSVIEVGAEETIRMSWTYNPADGGAPDYPNAVFLFDSDEVDRSGYINGNSYFDFEYILFGAPAVVGMNVEIPYAEGPIKNDLTFGDPYPTGRIPSWFAAAAINMEGKYYSLYGSALTLPDGTTIRNYDKSPNNQYTIIIGASDTVSFVFVPTGKSLVSIIDTSNLNAVLTNDYQVQAMAQAPDAGGTNFSGVYYALFFSPYGAGTNHVVTIQ